jgi:UDP-N-acetylmuramoyl-L-alanyl-D-glutamate--2,6-diaminopimelate ligase
VPDTDLPATEAALPDEEAVPLRWADVTRLVGAAGAAADGPDLVVRGVALDSRRVSAGNVFAALPGANAHGADYVTQARDRGAAAVLTDEVGAGPARAAGLPVAVVREPREVLGELCAAAYGRPARAMRMLGVTGTNGKTTSTWLLEAGARACGLTTGVVGTVATRIADRVLPAERTTPEAPDLQALFARMRRAGVECVAMEVSSHALAQGRVDGITFDVAAFTNLSQDHLDFHGDMQRYFAAKAELFTPARCRRAVVVVDDDWGRRLVEQATVPTQTVTARVGGSADWAPTRVGRHRDGGWDVDVRGPADLTLNLRVSLLGRYNVANALTALAVLGAAGLDPLLAAEGIAGCTGVPGRLEPVALGQPFLALVDYAHTPDAIVGVLTTVREDSVGRVLLVVGAGGDRDHDKRPLMGAAAAAGADVVWVTDDNPRSEEPAAIRAAVLTGARDAAARSGCVVVEEPDRRRAIAAAVAQARPGDVVLVVGKGHEAGQEIAGVVHPFDDRLVLADALAAEVAS